MFWWTQPGLACLPAGGRFERKKNLWRNNIILFLALVLVIFILPVFTNHERIASRVVLGIVVISGVFAAEFRRKIFGILLLLGTVAIITMAIGIVLQDVRSLNVVAFLLMTCSLILSTIALVSHVAGSMYADKSTILCAINSYLMIGLTASVLFIIIDLINPSSFIHLPAGSGDLHSYIYFGFVTLTTLGYGDITPDAPLARSLSAFVALAGQLYLVIIMALIIGKYLNTKDR